MLFQNQNAEAVSILRVLQQEEKKLTPVKILSIVRMDDKCVDNFQTVSKVTEEVNALQYMGHALNTVLTCKRYSAANLVEIFGIPVYMDWLQWRENLYKYTANIVPDKKPDIIFIPAYDRIAPLGFKIQHIIRSLKKQYVVITNALYY